MCEAPFWKLEPRPLPPTPQNIYICEVTMAPRVRNFLFGRPSYDNNIFIKLCKIQIKQTWPPPQIFSQKKKKFFRPLLNPHIQLTSSFKF